MHDVRTDVRIYIYIYIYIKNTYIYIYIYIYIYDEHFSQLYDKCGARSARQLYHIYSRESLFLSQTALKCGRVIINRSNYSTWKYFRMFNFRCLGVLAKNFHDENCPIYSIFVPWCLLSHHSSEVHTGFTV